MIAEDWTEHRREDGERVGWIRPVDELWQAIDLLGRELGEPVEWLEAEALLEARGIGWLADRWWLGPNAVRISEVSPEGVVVVTDDYGAAAAVGASRSVIRLPWPAPSALSATDPGRAPADPIARWYRDGRLLGYPNRPEVRTAVLAALAPDAIGAGERLAERAFTDRLAAMTTDPIRLRRELVDRGLVERTPDGAHYWLSTPFPTPAPTSR